MQKKLLAGLLSIALLFANINTSGLQVFASETELTTDEENDIDDYTELDETEKNLEYLSDSENEESETLEEVSETKETIEENTDVKESDSSSIEEGTDVKDIETEIENDASEEILTEETSVEESTKETLVDESTEQDVEEEIITEETLTEENIIEPLAEEANITINRTYLCAGREIELENNQRYYIKWYVDDQFVSEDNYTPTKDDYECWIKAVAYDDNDEAVCTDSVYFSKLPVVYIDTEDGQAVTDKSTYKDASMFIQNNEQVNSAVYDNSIQIKGRGNSTWDLPKKPYKIKLKNKTDFYGMGKNKHWVLIANYLDESLMRNTIAYNLSKKLGLINMDTVWVDVIINGDYAGNYQLCEHIRIGDERIDIADWESEAEDIAAAIYKVEKSNGMSKEVSSEIEDQMKEDLSWVSSGRVEYSGTEYDISTYVSNWNKDITGGYIFEMSIEYDEVSKFQTDHGLRVMVNSPEYLYTNTEMMDYIQEYWQAFENAYCSVDG